MNFGISLFSKKKKRIDNLILYNALVELYLRTCPKILGTCLRTQVVLVKYELPTSYSVSICYSLFWPNGFPYAFTFKRTQHQRKKGFMMLLLYIYVPTYVYPLLLLHLYYLSSWQITGVIFEVKGIVGFQVVSFQHLLGR